MSNNKTNGFGLDDQLLKYEAEQAALNRNKKSLYRLYDRSSIETNFDEPSVLARIEGSYNRPWYESAWNGVKLFVTEDVPDFFTEDIPNVMRMINEKRAQGFISEKLEQLRRLKEEDEGLSLVEEYLKLVNEFQALSTEEPTQENVLALEKIQLRLYELDDYFLSKEGRQNAAIRELMYDIKSDRLTSADKSQIASGNLIYGLEKTPESVKGESIYETAKNALNAFGTSIENALNVVGNVGVTAANLIGKGVSETGIGGYDDGYMTSKAILALPDENPLLQRLYKGANIAKDTESKKRYQDWITHNERLKNEYNLELDQYIDDFTNGNWKVPMSEAAIDVLKYVRPSKLYDVNAGLRINDMWDPEDVSQEWRTAQEQKSGSIWHPIYMLPEIGSTLGMIEGMIGTVALNVAAEAAVRKLPSIVAGGPSRKAIQMAFASGDMEKGIAMMLARLAALESTKVGVAEAAVRSAEITAGLGITTSLRVHETNMEAMQAVSSRLLKALNDSDADAQKVYDAIMQYEEEHGVDVSRLSPTDLIGEAIARDIYTGDPVFELQKKDALKGIMKLVNANNALALHDYLEVLPMTSYGEKALSYFGRLISGSAPTALTRPFYARTKATADVGTRNPAQFYRDVIANRANYAEQAAISKINPHWKEYYDTMFGAYDGAVEDVVKNLFKNKRLFAAFMTARGAKFIEEKMKKLPYTMTMEGFEEGIQTTLQQRHEAGEYDDYSAGYQQFSISDVLETPELAGHVVSAFFGLNGKGDDEIVKTTIIGAFIGSLFPLAGSAITNFSSNANYNNTRNLITQLKNDRVMTRLISENFDKIADEKKVRLFTEAFNRTGVNASRLTKSLMDIKDAVDTENGIINPDFVDGDILLLDAAWYMYNNKYINDLLEKRGIEKFGQKHKDIIANGAIAIVDALRSRSSVQEATKKIMGLLEPDNMLVDELFDPATSEERKQEIYAEHPLLKSNIDLLITQYNEYLQQVLEKNEQIRATNKKQKDKVAEKTKDLSIKDLLNLRVKDKNIVLDWIKEQLIHEGELTENSTYTDDYIRRKGTELLSNEGYRKALFSHLLSITPQLKEIETQSKSEFIKNYLNALNIHKQLKLAESIKLWINNDAQRLVEILALTGMDLDTNIIKGMSNGLDEFISKLKEEEAEYVKSENAVIQEQNKIRKENGEDPLPLATLADVFKDELANLTYDFEDDYQKWIRSFMLNSILKYALDRIAAAYRDPASIVPEELNMAIFGKDAMTSYLFSDVDAYKKKQAVIDALPEADRKYSSVEQEDLSLMRQDTSWKMILHDLEQTRKERERVIHPKQDVLLEAAIPGEQEEDAGIVTVQQQKEDQKAEQEQEDDELEKILSEAQNQADRVEVSTMHKDPKELQRERSRQEKRNAKSEAAQKAEVKDNNKEDDKHPHSNQDQLPEQPVREEKPAPVVEPDPVIPIKPEAPDNNSTISDQIGDPIVIDGKNYYKYAVTTYGPGYNSTTFVIADAKGNIVKDSPYAFVTSVPTGYKVDISTMTADEIGNLDGMLITLIIHADDGRSGIKTNLGSFALIKDTPVDPTVDVEIADKISAVENSPSFGGVPMLLKTDSGITIVQVETLYKLSNGDIIGRIEENGLVYYYIVRSRQEQNTAPGTITYDIEKYNTKGQKIDTNNIFVNFEPDNKWQDSGISFGTPGGTVAKDYPVSIQYTEQTNTPIMVTVRGDGWMQVYSRLGLEDIDKNDKDDGTSAPNIDEIEDEKIDESSKDSAQEQQDEQSAEIDDIINKYEQERLEEEHEKLETVEAESRNQLEELLSSPGVVDADENGKIMIGGLVLDDSLLDAIGVQEELLYKLEFGIGLDQDDIPAIKHNKKESLTKDEAYDYVSSVFFYQPTATEPMRLAIGGKDIKLPYKLATGSEFSKNLVKKGWLEKLHAKGKVYYVVTLAEDAAYKKENRTIEQDMDTFTVTLIVEDDETQSCYACSLRQLGKYISKGYEKDPVTGEKRKDQAGEYIETEFPVNRELELRDKLSRIHTVYALGKNRQLTYENERFGVAKTEYERQYGSRPQTPPENAPEEEWEKHRQDTLEWEAKVKNWMSDKYVVPHISGESKDQYLDRVEQHKEIMRRINERARYNLRQIGKRPLSDARISEMIDNLRKVRNEIINAYLSKDDDGKFIWPDVEHPRKDVTPLSVTKSNGRYNNKKTEGGQPILQNVTRENNPFGAKQDVSELNTQIQNGEIKLGIGTGSVNSNNKNAIQDFREGCEETTYDGKGLAGKVFIIVDGVNNTLVPVMLSELKLNKQHTGSEIPEIIGAVNDNLQMCIHPYTGSIIQTDKNIKPSAAEVILYLLFNKLDKSLLPKGLEKSLYQFAQFFVHVGEETLLSNSNVEAALPYYAAKLLAMIQGNLVIGMPIVNAEGMPVLDRDGRIQYRQRSYSAMSLFGADPISERNRRDVIRAIASQMHWNTDKIAMRERFGGDSTNLIAQELEEYFNSNPDQETFTLAGVPEFLFNKHDLFEVDEETGEVTRIKKNMTMAAWMLHTGRLMSDVGDTVFKDPFVFADGIVVAPNQKLRKDAEKADAVLPTGDIDVTKTAAKTVIVLDDPTKQQRVRSKIGGANPNSVIAKAVFHNEQEYIDAMIDRERLANSENTKKYGPTVRVIALDLPTTIDNKLLTVDDIKNAAKDKVADLIKNLDPKLIGSKELFEDADTYDSVQDSDYRLLMSPRTKWLLLARISENGHIKLWATNYVGSNTRPQKGSINIVNGVYQTTKTGGSFDEEYARKWLLNKLGLTSNLIFVSNALLKGTENEQVFGVTNVALDSLRKQLMGYMILSTSAGIGVQFHEAFHYVNLLLHTKEQRMAIYRDYVEHHKEYKNKTLGEIEEAIAEDFRTYMEGVEGVSISSKIRNFFRKVMDLLVASRRKTAYRQVFDAIHKGYYKNNHHMDPESIKEFMKKYPKGVHQLRITGIPFYKTSDMKNIPTPHDFYQVADAIMDFIVQRSDIKTPEDALALGGNKFSNVLKQLKDYADSLDEATAGMIMDFYNNPDVLQYVLISRFASLGIIAKNVKLDDRSDVDNDATAKEDTPDNIWDRFLFSISKMDSVMFRAKLFLRLIPKAHFVLNDDGTRSPEYDNNDILPDVYKYERFEEAWNKIVSATNKCVGYGVADENGLFPYNSFRGIVKRLAKADQFFAALDEKLDEIEGDYDLETLIYTAVNSQKPRITFFEILAAKSIRSMLDEDEIASMDEEAIADLQRKANENQLADRMKQWVFRNDNTLQAVRAIPRRWSNSLLLSGIVDLKLENPTISKEYTDILLGKINEIQDEYDRVFGKKVVSKMSQLDLILGYVNISELCVSLCDYLGVSMDQDVIDYFVNLKTTSESYIEKAAVLYNSFTKTTTGTIGYMVHLLANNAGNTKLINRAGDAAKKLKEAKPIETIFAGTKLSSDISKLALSYHALYPNSADFGVFGPNKEMIYPISLNNFQSSKLRNLNTTGGQHALDMRKSPYAKHSIILDTAKDFEDNVSDDDQFHLNLEVGLKDTTSQDGADFFGTTSLEDYVQMMLTLDFDPDFVPINAKSDFKSNESTHLASPTMADKKSHYSISSKAASFRTSHEPVIGMFRPDLVYSSDVQEFSKEMFGIEDPVQLGRSARMSMLNAWAKFNPLYKYRKLSDATILRFTNYFLDELESLILYYDKKNIAEVVKDPNKRISNFHGKVKGGMMDFSGNGGKFRYFYDTIKLPDGNGMNLNHRLEWLFKLEKDILSSKKVKLKSSQNEELNAALKDIDPLATSVKDFDGFELVRAELNKIKLLCFEKNGRTATKFLQNCVNEKLFTMIDYEIYRTSVDPSLHLSEWVPSLGYFVPVAIPAQLLARQNARFVQNKRAGGSRSYIPYTNQSLDAMMFYSLMANHVVNSFTSIIEFEKVFSADPAQYKWKDIKGEYATEKHSMTYTLPSGEVVELEYYVSNLADKFSDKIKRLGSILSPGDEARLDLSELEKVDEELNPEGYLNSCHYTKLVVDDVIAKSQVLDSVINPKFKNNLIADYIRNNDIKEVLDYIKLRLKKDPKYNKERLINDIIDSNKVVFYDEMESSTNKGSDRALLDDLEDYGVDITYISDEGIKQSRQEYRKYKPTLSTYIFNILPNEVRKDINKKLEQLRRPYENITVSDAQIFMRPKLYRKIRMSLGMWTTVEDETGYSDELAYRILEEDPTWQRDPEKAAIVNKLELFPLKMSYVGNEPHRISKGNNINIGTLDKAAYFPLFKYTASNQVGQRLYDRMNKEGLEIDIVSFVSAVKVGSPQQIPSLFKDGSVSSIQDVFDNDSDTHVVYSIDSSTGKDVLYTPGKNKLPVLVQDLHLLRYQLNTRAHEATERGLGTQAAKLGFSNIIDTAQYGRNKKGLTPRFGWQIKEDVMACIKALSVIEQKDLEGKYFKTVKNLRRLNDAEVHKLFEKVAKSLNLGPIAEEILQSGVAESLSSRKLFEQKLSALVGKKIIDINLNGGTAVQQSMIGFNDYDNRHVVSDEDLIARNNVLGKKVEEVFDLSQKQLDKLSADGIVTVEDFVNSKSSLLKNDAVKERMEYLNIHKGDKILDFYHKLNNGREIKWHAKENSMQVILSLNFFRSIIPEEFNKTYESARKWLLDNNIIGDNSKPFGIGYRIPTQGMSSMFAFQVADVLPYSSGDVIIVPREFTAQTGSDFDVDKLFLATFSYEKGFLPVDEEGNVQLRSTRRAEIINKDGVKNAKTAKELLSVYEQESISAIQNQLLLNYIDIITDDRNYGEARGSIDVVTGIIGDDLLSWLRPASVSYLQGMYELLPSFLLSKKQEFKVGKDGIGPFALNATNIGLTQLVHLSIDYDKMGVKDYDFGDLDKIDGQDGLRIAAWLSAMINAHVDVAKDPYVFTLNVNKATYDYANFLLRAGKGISTFTFLTQPILVEYATLFINGGGMYGKNLSGKETLNKSKNQISNEIKKNLAVKYLNEAEKLLKLIPADYKMLHKDQFNRINQIITTTKYIHQYTRDQKRQYKDSHNGKAPAYEFSRKSIFNYNTAKLQILNYKNARNTIDKLNATVYQLVVLLAFNEINPCAKAISDLVLMSLIDTKKYGNTVMSLINYANRVREFKYSNKVAWTITIDSDELNNEPSHALRKYYSDTFLDQKLLDAIRYIRELGSRELLVASDTFQTIFNDIAAQVNGLIEIEIPKTYTDKKGRERVVLIKNEKDEKKVRYDVNKEPIFKPFMKEDTVNALSTAIDNLMRFNILINMANTTVSGNALERFETRPSRLLTSNEEQFDSYDYLEEGPIDFVYGGNYNAIVTNVMRLFYGDESHPSLPMRIKRFISDVLSDPYGEDAVGIVENNKIINDFLMYLNPIPATKDIPVDRLNLNESAIRTSRAKKESLQSYWNELLTHPSKRVRQLARDIAIYSYYSTYDTSTTNTITDLIPPYFRLYYDQSITSAVRENGVKLSDVATSFFGINGSDEIIKKQGIGLLYYDIIARNYWYDDDIVHRVHEHGKGTMNTKANYIEYRAAYATDPKSGQKFPGMIISSNFVGHPLYVKMVKGTGSVLYRRIGSLHKINSKGKDELINAYVYVAVQKAGMHVGKTHMFEFFKTQFIPSMFKQNMLPAAYDNQDLVNDLVNNQIPTWTKAAPGYRYTFTAEDLFVMPVDNTEKLNKFVYKEKIKNKTRSILNGYMRVSLKKNPKTDAMLYSDLILKFVTDQSKINKEDRHYDKTVYIDISNPNAVSDIINRMQELKLDKRVNRSIYVDINESDFTVTDEDIEKLLNIIVDYYMTQYYKDNPDSTLELADYFERNIEESMRDYAKEIAHIYKMSTAVNISLQTLITNGYLLLAMYASGLSNATRAALNAYEHNIDYFSTPLMSNLFVSKLEYNDDSYEQYISNMELSIQVEDLYVEDSAVADENMDLENEQESKEEETIDLFGGMSADDDVDYEDEVSVDKKEDESNDDIVNLFKKPESPEDTVNGEC